MSDLPEGWCVTNFGTVADIQLGKMLDKAKNKGTPTPYLRNINVRWGEIDTSDVSLMPMSDSERAKFAIQDGDVLVCEGGEPGRAAVWRAGSTDLKFQKAILRVRARSAASPEWLAHYLWIAARDGTLEQRFTGTTIKHLPRETLANTPVPLAPLPEQRRIATKIDSLSAKSSRARDQLDRIPHLVGKYKHAVLTAAFRKKRSPGVPVVSLEEICDIRSGFAYSSGDFHSKGPVPVVRIGDIHNGAVAFDESSRYLPSHFLSSASQFIIERGDILVALSGATTGKSGIYDLEQPALLNQRVARLRARTEADRTLISLFLHSISNEILNASYGGAQPNISPGKLGKFQLVWPDEEERVTKAKQLTSAMRWIDRLVAETTAGRKLLDRVDQVILTQAFRGELVSQDPSDEPASVLLERIKAGQAKAPELKLERRSGTAVRAT